MLENENQSNKAVDESEFLESEAVNEQETKESQPDTEESKNEDEQGDVENSFLNPLADDVQEQIKAEKDKFLRLFAEFENYKKRTIKERISLMESANKELMVVLLPILDDFERAMAELKKNEENNDQLQGVELIYKKLNNSLIQKGLSKIEVAKGDDFNVEIHEAITQINAPSEELKGKVIDVIENGYKLGEKIIRYSKVVVGS